MVTARELADPTDEPGWVIVTSLTPDLSSGRQACGLTEHAHYLAVLVVNRRSDDRTKNNGQFRTSTVPY